MRTLSRAAIAAASLLLSAGVGAQTATSAQAPKPDQTVTTIVGCLVQGNPAEGKADPGTEKPAEYFVRTPTVVLPVGATIAVGKPGTTSTATSAGTATKDSYYRLTGLGADQLRPHVGHRVEIQGHLMARNPDAAAGGITTTKTTVDRAGKPTVTVETRMDVAGDLHATGLKMISASCE
jgi:hypothetical protein